MRKKQQNYVIIYNFCKLPLGAGNPGYPLSPSRPASPGKPNYSS